MPFVKGYLNVVERQPGRPDNELPGGEGRPVDPDFGVEIPEPPVGVWPPLTPEQPWRPIDPGFGVGRPPHVGGGPARPPVAPGRPDQGLPGEEGGEVTPPIALPPGTIWPPLPPGVHGKYLALVLIAGMPGVKYRYVVIDADLRPDQGLPGGGGGAGGRPENPIAPTPAPKK